MRTISLANRRLKRAAVPSALIMLVCYFLYHAVQGENGLLALREFDARAEVLRVEAVRLSEERKKMAARVALLRPDSLDPDMLDEQARKSLGFIHPDEVVILSPNELLETR